MSNCSPVVAFDWMDEVSWVMGKARNNVWWNESKLEATSKALRYVLARVITIACDCVSPRAPWHALQHWLLLFLQSFIQQRSLHITWYYNFDSVESRLKLIKFMLTSSHKYDTAAWSTWPTQACWPWSQRMVSHQYSTLIWSFPCRSADTCRFCTALGSSITS